MVQSLFNKIKANLIGLHVFSKGSSTNAYRKNNEQFEIVRYFTLRRHWLTAFVTF